MLQLVSIHSIPIYHLSLAIIIHLLCLILLSLFHRSKFFDGNRYQSFRYFLSICSQYIFRCCLNELVRSLEFSFRYHIQYDVLGDFSMCDSFLGFCLSYHHYRFSSFFILSDYSYQQPIDRQIFYYRY